MYKINGLIAVSMLGLVACGGSGGGGGESPVLLDGVFKDSNVSGLSYETGEKIKVTDANGVFEYEEGADVKFNVGKVILGTTKGKSVITPLDLVVGGKLQDDSVINRVLFLMMLDKDGDASNGISISKALQTAAQGWPAIDFSSTEIDFRVDANVIKIINEATGLDSANSPTNEVVIHSLPTKEKAQSHFRTTLLCANAGAYIGSYTGSEVGNIVLVVDPTTGEVNGSTYNPLNRVSVNLINTSAIDYDEGLNFVTSENSAKVFSGLLQSSNEISGDWVNDASEDEARGAFTLRDLVVIMNPFTGTQQLFEATNGAERGIYTFNVDATKQVSGFVYSVVTGEESSLTGEIDGNDKLTATSLAGDDITGFIDPVTLAFTTGSWINGVKRISGDFAGGGCLLN